MSSPLPLQEVEEVRITSVVDNSIDILAAGSEVAQRYPLNPRWLPDVASRENPLEPMPVAEHGFSALIEVRQGDRRGEVIFDTGISRNGMLQNMDILEIRPSDIQAIVLSHGHTDHTMGLLGLAERTGACKLPLVLHPDAYLERKLVIPGGYEIKVPPPGISDLRQDSVEVIEEVGPSMLVDDMVLISGEVARTTDFEKGMPIHHAKRNDAWEPDPLILDDQCAIVNVRDKGLVILTGCGHAGIINIIRNAQAITGVQAVYAVMGGFHLTGGMFEPIIPATIQALQQIGPRYLVPGHCTGSSAMHQIAEAMPDAFIANSVGTTYVL